MNSEFTPGEMMARVAKLLGIGLNPETGTPVESSQAAARCPDPAGNADAQGAPAQAVEPAVCPNCGQWQHRSSGDCFNECAKRGFAQYDPWAERREAFSNEGEVEP
jgi:hypothetical protein